MLGKLLKYELRITSKVMLAVDLALVLLTLIGCCILNTNIFDNKDAAPMAVFMVILYALSLTALGIATMIYLYFRFYSNLFTAEGYLMHTLPVTPAQLFHSKLAAGYLWGLLNSTLIIFSILSIGFVAGFHFASTHGIDVSLQLLEEINIETAESGNWANAFYKMFGYTPLQFFLQLLVLQLVSNFASLLTGYLSILLGQLVEKYKLMASVGFYIALYIINQIICSIMMVLPGPRILVKDTSNFLHAYYKDMMGYAIASQIFIGIAFYLAALFLMRRSVNLD